MNDCFHPLFSKLQCEFRVGFNEQQCLLVLVEKCLEVLDKQINCKAAIAYGFSLESLTFIKSYLSNQIQKVKMNPSFSDYSNVESGVPQGSKSFLIF